MLMNRPPGTAISAISSYTLTKLAADDAASQIVNFAITSTGNTAQ